MTVAQTKAARRKFRSYYRSDTPIGTPRYKRKSISRMDRQEQARREKTAAMMNRNQNKKK